MNRKPYPQYKDSGVQWLGEVPEHWELWKIAHAFQDVGSGTTPPSNNDVWYDGSIPWVTTSELREGIIYSTIKKVSKEALEEFSALKLFPSGALAIAMYGATIGRLGIFGIPATTNQACCVMSGERSLTTRFLFFWFQAFRDQIVLLASGGGQPNISQDKIRSVRVACPSKGEQTTIADFLDEQTGKIDRLIGKKRELIARLKEKRTALISRAVTRGLPADAAREFGLPPHTRFKDSGIDWLGEVPEGWEVVKVWIERVSRNIEFQDGNHGELHPKAEDYVSDGIPFVMANHIANGQVDFTRCNYIEQGQADKLRIGFSITGDVLLTHKGTVGRVGLVQGNDFPYIMLTPQVTYYRCLRRLFNKFLFWHMQSIFWQDQLKLVGGLGSTRSYVGLLDQRTLMLLIPDQAEQKAIATYLDRETAKIDKLLGKVEVAIARLQEYRTALITAAVTGKIDVREQAA